MKKRVCIDINDTVRDNLGQFEKVYYKFKDGRFRLDLKSITSTYHPDYFPFKDNEEYELFKYEDYPFELYARAEVRGGSVVGLLFNQWLEREMSDYDEEECPEVIFVSPFEIGLTIPSTMSFLSRINSRVREIYFPLDSSTIWDRCDILITANPKFIEEKPEDKELIVVSMPYNEKYEVKHRVKDIQELVRKHNEVVLPLLEK